MLILGAKCGHFCCTPLPQGWFEMVATSHGDFLVSASGPVMFRFHERSQVFSSTSLKKNGLEIEEGNFSFFLFFFYFFSSLFSVCNLGPHETSLARGLLHHRISC